MRILRKIFKIGLFVVLGIVLLNVLLYLLLLIPAVQQSVLQFALNRIRPIIKTEVRIDHIQLRLFNHVKLEGVYLADQSGDTLLYAKNFTADIDPWKLLDDQVVIKGITLDDFSLKVSRKDTASNYNYQFLIDAFASKDTTKSQSPSKLTVLIEDVQAKNGRLRMDTKSAAETPREFNVSHLALSDFETKLSLPSIASEKLDIRVSKLGFKDKSGLVVEKANFDLKSKGSIFTVKDAKLKLPQSTLDLPFAEYDLASKTINLDVKPTNIIARDLLCFLPGLKQLKEDIHLEGKVKGKLPLISAENLNLTYGKQLELKADGEISDYGNYKNAKIRLQINSFRTTQSALRDIMRISDSTYVFPKSVQSLGDIRLKGTADGTLANMNIVSDVWTRQGAASIKTQFHTDSTFKHMSAKGSLLTQNFNLQPFTTAGVGRISGQVNFDYAQNGSNNIALKANGLVNSVQYQKANYRNIHFAANYSPQKISGKVNANMTQGKIVADFNMLQGKSPVYVVNGSVENLHLNSFYRYDKWKNPYLSAVIKANIQGDFQKGIAGSVQVENMRFVDGSTRFTPGLISFEAGKSNSKEDFMKLNSSFLDARIDGKINFATLTGEIQNIAHRYLPQFILPVKAKMTGQNNFKFTAQTKDTRQLEQIFDSPVSLTQPLTANGEINTSSKFIKIETKAPFMKYQQADVKESIFNLTNENEKMNLTAHTRYFKDDNRMELYVNADAESDTIRSQINYSNETPDLNLGGQIDSYTFFGRNKKNQLITNFNIEPSMIYVNELRFLLNPANVINENGRTLVSNLGMKVEGKKYLNINGVVSNSNTDTLHVNFTNAKLASVLTAFSINNIDAKLNGAVNIASAMKYPQVFTDNFQMENIIVSKDTVGTLNLASRWQEASQAVDVDAHLVRDKLQLADITGLVYVGDTAKLNLDIKSDQMPIAWIQTFTSDYLNKLNGQLSSELKVRGTLSSPVVDGWIGIKDGIFGLEVNNVEYALSDTIYVTPHKIGFENLKLTDPQGNTASLDGAFLYDRLDKYNYTLNAKLKNFMVLNTENRTDSLYYGKIFTSGTATVKGTPAGMDIKLDISNAKNSTLNVLLPQSSQAVKYQGIVYINTPQDSLDVKKKPVKKNENSFLMRLFSNLKISDNLKLYVLLDPASGNSIQMEGNGDVDFSYDSKTGNMKSYGNYDITKGRVKMNLQHISNMELDVQEGSTLTFNGDPRQTSFNITAFKDVRADLSTLDANFANDYNLSSTRVPVRCVLGITGDMNKMNLTYDVQLPEANDDVQQKVKALLATDDQKIQQFVYLIFMGSFYGHSDNNLAQDFAVNGMVTSFASSALNKTLDAVFGRVLGDKWDIGTDISSRDGSMNNLDVSLNVSTHLLDNRLRIKTNFGYKSSSDISTTQSFVGNVDIEYILNRFFKLRMYTKENDKYYLSGSTTQGLGVVYTKEVKRFKDFFRFLKKKKKPQKTENSTSTKPTKK